MSKHTRAAIVGSGFGGLAAAIRLQAAGIQTTVFEARDKPGGRAYVYQQDGFTFDAGPTVITAPHCLEELFAVAGKRMDDYVELMPVDPFYRLLWQDGDTFEYTNDEARLLAQIASRNPDDVQGYQRFLEYSRRVFQTGYEGLAAEPFLRFFDMVKVAPELIRLRADRSVYSTVSRFIKDDHLRQALSFHSLLVGGNPFETSAIYTLIHYLERRWGVFFPRGGTGALVRALVRLYGELGGDIRLDSPVSKIRLSSREGQIRHLVTTPTQTDESFDLVVSNADLVQTYDKLYAGDQRAAQTARRLKGKDWSMSLFVLYFGTNRKYPGTAHHTVIFGPRYRELLADIAHGPAVPDDFSLYLHAPSVTDPSLAPLGCESFYVLAPVPHLGHAAVDWESKAPGYADRILAALERWLPDLRQHIITKRWFTPADFHTTLGAHLGSAFSLAPTLKQSAYFRSHNRDPKIPGLYIVGSGTHPGAGIPGVVNSAKATARLVQEDFGARAA